MNAIWIKARFAFFHLIDIHKNKVNNIRVTTILPILMSHCIFFHRSHFP